MHVVVRSVAVAALLLCTGATLFCTAARAEFVWWEAEKADRTNFAIRNSFSAETFADTRDQLSGGDWLSSDSREKVERFALYRVAVPADGEYELWTRKFWKHGPFKWRFDQQDWQMCGKDCALADETPLRKFVCVNWVHLGRVKLAKGERFFQIRITELDGPAAFDCFVLSTTPFAPKGKLKPGEKSGKAEEGFFAFEPAVDSFGEAALDLRLLNEKEAGESGFIRRGPGGGFVLGGGKPVRFFAVNIGPEVAKQDHASIDYLARKLAKLGVNMVRFHGNIFDINKPAAIDAAGLDAIHYLVSAMKRQGIYTKISFYFPLWHRISPDSDIPGYGATENKHPFALLYFEPKIQGIYKEWARKLLTTPSPYTKRPLADDPAVAMVEVINEDSFFFWTFGQKTIPPRHWGVLESLYSDWLTKRYGALDKAMAAWDGAAMPADNLSGRIALAEAWGMTSGGLKGAGPGKRKRISDQVTFLADLQRAFYADMARYFKTDLKLRALVSASNWTTADPSLLDAVERWTYTAADVIDQHGYFGGRHEGDGAGFSVRVGHTYADLAPVCKPESLPIRCARVEGRPQIISEIGYTNPNRFRADTTLLSAAYASLQGIDGLHFFAIGSAHMLDQGMGKFGLCSPVIANTFPAAALLYRRGDVKTPDPAVYEVLNPDDLLALKGSGVFSVAALDDLRQRDIPENGNVAGPISKIDPLACYVGPVIRAFGKDTSKSYQKDLTKFIDRKAGTVKSLTGEVALNYSAGLLRIDTPRAQGAAGFLAKARKIELTDLSIECTNDYGAITAIALDDQPLASSKKILLQVMTEEKLYGFKTEKGGITSLGTWPWNVRKVAGQVTMKSPAKVTALDENGYAIKKPVKTEAGAIHLAEDCIYYLLTRDTPNN